MTRQDWWIVGGIAALLFTTGGVVYMSDWKKRGEKYLPLLHDAERRYNIPHDLLARQAYQESRFREDIITGEVQSPAGALGIMQIIPRWHPEARPLDPPQAIDYAARFLANLRQQFGSWALALAAYNAGPSNVKKYGGVPPFPETEKYVREILTDVGLPTNV